MEIKIRIKYLIYAIIAMLLITVILLFINTPTSDVDGLNDFTLYRNTSVNGTINYTLKEAVKETTQSTTGLNTGSSSSTSNLSSTDDTQEVWELIKKYASEYNVDPVFLAVICAQESTFGKDKGTSTAGAQGLMQLKTTEGPIQELKQQNLWESSMTLDLQDDDNNMHIATVYLKYGYDRFVKPQGKENDIGAWAAGYNSWWDTTIWLDPPHLSGTENTNYYNQTKQRYADYVAGVKKIGEK